jgi:tetratricopeptide (TPR) repeat protein
MQLIDSATGFHILSRSFDRPLDSYFEMRDELTELVVANVRVALPSEERWLGTPDFLESDLNAYVLYRRGKDLYAQPRTPASIAGVIAYYQQALELDGDYAAAHAGLCEAYIARYDLSSSEEDISLAESACAAALAANPRLYMVHTALGELYRRTGQVSKAEYAYNNALQINPQDAAAMAGLARVYRLGQNYQQAEQLLQKAIEMQPGNWRAIDSLGTFLFSMGRFEEAAGAYRQVVLLDPENHQARNSLASVLVMAGDFEAGKLQLEESLEIHESSTAYSNLGVIYYYLGEFENSVAANRKAVGLTPGKAVNWLNLADALYFAQLRAEATDAFRRAEELAESRIEVDASDFDTLFLLAWAQQMLGKSEKAKTNIERGMMLAPNDAYGLYYSALVDVQMGHNNSALSSLRLAIENGYPTSMLAVEPYLEKLRGVTEFQDMISGSK